MDTPDEAKAAHSNIVTTAVESVRPAVAEFLANSMGPIEAAVVELAGGMAAALQKDSGAHTTAPDPGGSDGADVATPAGMEAAAIEAAEAAIPAVMEAAAIEAAEAAIPAVMEAAAIGAAEAAISGAIEAAQRVGPNRPTTQATDIGP